LQFAVSSIEVAVGSKQYRSCSWQQAVSKLQFAVSSIEVAVEVCYAGCSICLLIKKTIKVEGGYFKKAVKSRLKKDYLVIITLEHTNETGFKLFLSRFF
jgi:hypothetical protein